VYPMVLNEGLMYSLMVARSKDTFKHCVEMSQPITVKKKAHPH